MCGRVAGYQFCSTDGFDTHINDVDGIYMLIVSASRTALQGNTYYGGLLLELMRINSCPCVLTVHTVITQQMFPPLLAVNISITTELAVAHPLWDGGGCGPTGGCCESSVVLQDTASVTHS